MHFLENRLEYENKKSFISLQGQNSKNPSMENSKYLKSFLLLLFPILVLLSCSSTQRAAEKRQCSEYPKNDFSRMSVGKYKNILKNDTVTYGEVRFECVHTAFITAKVMFDHFGKWNRALVQRDHHHLILMWQNVDLFSDGKRYTVVTDGRESPIITYGSFMAFTQKGEDIIANSLAGKDKIVNLFKKWIRNNDSNKREFYETYWPMYRNYTKSSKNN